MSLIKLKKNSKNNFNDVIKLKILFKKHKQFLSHQNNMKVITKMSTPPKIFSKNIQNIFLSTYFHNLVACGLTFGIFDCVAY